MNALNLSGYLSGRSECTSACKGPIDKELRCITEWQEKVILCNFERGFSVASIDCTPGNTLWNSKSLKKQTND